MVWRYSWEWEWKSQMVYIGKNIIMGMVWQISSNLIATVGRMKKTKVQGERLRIGKGKNYVGMIEMQNIYPWGAGIYIFFFILECLIIMTFQVGIMNLLPSPCQWINLNHSNHGRFLDQNFKWTERGKTNSYCIFFNRCIRNKKFCKVKNFQVWVD